MDLSRDLLPATRESLDGRRRASAAALDFPGVEVVDETVPVEPGRTVGVRIYRGARGWSPVTVYLHSGAFVLGNLDVDHRQCLELARGARCTVISVDYRLAPEHPHPCALDDALAVLNWVADDADRLSVDASRIAVAGNSAGGALAALLAQRAGTGRTPPVVFQLLHQPVLDDRETPSKGEFSTTPGFDGPASRLMWHHLCGPGGAPPGAVPARTADLGRVPRAFISYSELDPLRDEAIAYAGRLMQAGTWTELHLVPGTCHGFDSLLPEWEVSQQLFGRQCAALLRALHPPVG